MDGIYGVDGDEIGTKLFNYDGEKENIDDEVEVRVVAKRFAREGREDGEGLGVLGGGRGGIGDG